MISLLVIACNEEHRLEACIASCRPAVDEVVVVVQESQDRTLEIAKRCADAVATDKCWGLSHCANEWLLNLDADEILTPHAAAHLRALCQMDVADVLLIPHSTYIGGQLIERYSRPRLFRKDAVECPSQIHSVFTARPGRRTLTLNGPDWISHRKSWDEQHLDDARYARVAAAPPG